MGTPFESIVEMRLILVLLTIFSSFAFARLSEEETYCRELLTSPLVAGLEQLRFASSESKVSETLGTEKIKSDTLLRARALSYIFANPNLAFEFKLRHADAFAKSTVKTLAMPMWLLLSATITTQTESNRILLYESLSSKEALPDFLLDMAAQDLANNPSSVMVRTLWGLVGSLPKISHPKMVAALRTYYLTTLQGDRPSRSQWSADAPAHVNAYQQRIQNRMEALRFQQSAMHFILSKTDFDRDTIYKDFENLVLVDDHRSFAAFTELRQANRLSLEVIRKIASKLNGFKDSEMSQVLAAEVWEIFAEAEKNSNYEILAVEFFQYPEIRSRGAILDRFRKIDHLKSEEAKARLAVIAKDLEGHSRLIAERLSVTTATPSKVATGSASIVLNSKLVRSMLADTIHDALGFSSIRADTVASLHSVVMDNGIPAKSQSVLNAIRLESWGKTQKLAPPNGPTSTSINTVLTTVDWKPATQFDHSMFDVGHYLEERVGKNVLRLATSSEAAIQIFAGSETEMRKYFSSGDMMKIPNPYSLWDIDRYVRVDAGKAAIVFRIQPNLQLARHYQAMFHQAGIQNLEVVLSENGRQQIKDDYVEAARQLRQKIGADPQALVLGYEGLWSKLLQTHPLWMIEHQQEAEVSFGQAHIRAQVFHVAFKPDPSKKRVFMVAGSNKTLWGEATVAMVEGILSNQPELRDVLFLGSAGSLGYEYSVAAMGTRRPEVNRIYGISVPDLYIKMGRGRFLTNTLNLTHYCSSATTEEEPLYPGGPKIEATICSHHGFSNSPAEQTQDFTSQLIRDGINTIDVETNLLLAAIADWNDKHEPKVHIGAAHLLTDNPASAQLIWDVPNTLSQVDASRKQQLRENIVNYALTQWSQRFAWSSEPDGGTISNSFTIHDTLPLGWK
jgi:hypothetical protein